MDNEKGHFQTNGFLPDPNRVVKVRRKTLFSRMSAMKASSESQTMRWIVNNIKYLLTNTNINFLKAYSGKSKC